jgi:2-methylcitrate dehydratase PrpD
MAGRNAEALGAYIAGAAERAVPPEILDAARLCLADWMGVALGARDEPAGRIVRETLATGPGSARVIFGAKATAPFAALANGTLAHCLDFDDTYVDAITHTSAPVWAAVLALGQDIGADEQAMLRAFITGFEVTARVGHGLGQAVTARGWHGTGVFGRVGSAAAAAALLGLGAAAAVQALALAVTQTAGLTASFGTMAKPFHAGKAAMDGIIAARLAQAGMTGAPGLLESGGGLDTAVIQDGALTLPDVEFSGWRITRNSFKPYAACHLIHPAIDAARALRADGLTQAAIRAVRAEIGPLAMQVTGTADGAPRSALAGKFDLRYCVALALHGHPVSAADFREPFALDPAIAATAGRIVTEIGAGMGFASARLTVEAGNASRAIHVPEALGHPGNPMGWDDMASKFAGLVEPVLGGRTDALFALTRGFGAAGGMAGIEAILAGLAPTSH